jgi:hypothetical protein
MEMWFIPKPIIIFCVQVIWNDNEFFFTVTEKKHFKLFIIIYLKILAYNSLLLHTSKVDW